MLYIIYGDAGNICECLYVSDAYMLYALYVDTLLCCLLRSDHCALFSLVCVWAIRRQMAGNPIGLPLKGKRVFHFHDRDDRSAWVFDPDTRRLTYTGGVTEDLLDNDGEVEERSFYRRGMQYPMPPLDWLMETTATRAGPTRAPRAAADGPPRGPRPRIRARRRESSPPEEKPALRPRSDSPQFTPTRYRFTEQPRVVIETRVVETPVVQLDVPVVTLVDTDEEVEGAQEGGLSPEYTPATPPEDPFEEPSEGEYYASSGSD